MLKRLALGLAALFLLTLPAFAAPNAVVSYSVGVCDPSFALRCIKPNADGSIPAGQVDATSTDASGTVTLGGTYQLVIAASSTRKGCLIQNTHATEALSVRVGTTTVYTVAAAGGTFQCSAGSGIVVSDPIYVTAVTTTHPFSANFQ